MAANGVAVPAEGAVLLFPDRRSSPGQTPAYDWTASVYKNTSGQDQVTVTLTYQSTGYENTFGFMSR